MSKNHYEAPTFRSEAQHVKEFFWKEVSTLIQLARELPPRHLKELLASHHFLFLKSLQIPTLASQFSSAPKKTSTFPYAQREESKWVGRLDQSAFEGRGLSKERVKGWRLKESACAKKQFESLLRAKTSTTTHKITPITDSDSPDPRSQEWQDLLASHEERHFQITRITKILSQ